MGLGNPWLRVGPPTPPTWPLGPAQSPTDNFSGLPNTQAKGLGVINPTINSGQSITQPFGDIILPPWQITLAGTPTSGGTISRYLIFSEDNVHWPGGISPTATADQSAALANWFAYDPVAATLSGALLDQLTMGTGTVYITRQWFLRGLVGNLPTYCAIVIFNQSGVAFAAYASNNQVAQYVTDTYS